MLQAAYTKQFEKDVKRLKKRRKDLSKLRKVLDLLISEHPLEPKYRDHKLQGSLKDRRECHLEFDWVLVYKLTDIEIIFERTGTHSDLFE
jgi:mRNA interferase YafQ